MEDIVINRENATVDKEHLLQEINDQKATSLIPNMVFLAILMIIGVVGNAFVVYFWTTKCGPTSNTIFIRAIATYDLIICCALIPIEIVDMRLFYLFESDALCKIDGLLLTFFLSCSIMTLLAIAVDLYNKACRPLKRQLGIKGAKVSIVVVLSVSIFISWPAAVLFSSVQVDIVTANGVALQGHDCTMIRDDSYKVYLWLFKGFCGIAFVFCIVLLVVLYSLVGHVIYMSRRRHLNGTKTQSRDSQKDVVQGKSVVNSSDELLEDQAKDSAQKATPPETGAQKKTVFTIKALKDTPMMFVISLTFILSFLPCLILSIWRGSLDEYEGESLSGAELSALHFGLRSVYINSALNPMIYGYFTKRFRQYVKYKFCSCCLSQREKDVFFISEGVGCTTEII